MNKKYIFGILVIILVIGYFFYIGSMENKLATNLVVEQQNLVQDNQVIYQGQEISFTELMRDNDNLKFCSYGPSDLSLVDKASICPFELTGEYFDDSIFIQSQDKDLLIVGHPMGNYDFGTDPYRFFNLNSVENVEKVDSTTEGKYMVKNYKNLFVDFYSQDYPGVSLYDVRLIQSGEDPISIEFTKKKNADDLIRKYLNNPDASTKQFREQYTYTFSETEGLVLK